MIGKLGRVLVLDPHVPAVEPGAVVLPQPRTMGGSSSAAGRLRRVPANRVLPHPTSIDVNRKAP